jgi:hypothetical protein
MSVGQNAAQTREFRELFKPVFEDDSFQLSCPKMDDVVERQIVRSRHGKYIGQRELMWKSTQLKVLDVARPLISLWSRIDPATEEGGMLENAIRLWVEAHFFISKNRRANVMNSVYPRFKNLLKDPSKFSPSEVSHLFGPTFTSARPFFMFFSDRVNTGKICWSARPSSNVVCKKMRQLGQIKKYYFSLFLKF